MLSPVSFCLSKQSLYPCNIESQFFNPATTPVTHIGTGSYCKSKLCAPKIKLPAIPVCITLLTCHFPSKSNLELGHITGSQAPNNNLQSFGDITSKQLGPSFSNIGVSTK